MGSVDPFLKALKKATGCVYKLEDPVSESDFLLLSTIEDIEELKDFVSQRSRADIVVYRVRVGKYHKLLVKSDKTMSMDALAQTIGYYIASHSPDRNVQIALAISGSKAYLLLFPFRNRTTLYSDAIVTQEIDLGTHSIPLFKFVAKFIKNCVAINWYIPIKLVTTTY